ncbi:hypothetical protein E2C01_032821 [Portunus trituberculatus]|uniref:Secreted protein n=1 Tax=Portunus trituberculatus TaxID=210409 RepID=A0A5B7EW88_PORTR|nr:hypothetical protein [Portunus trituberculatus]
MVPASFPLSLLLLYHIPLLAENVSQRPFWCNNTVQQSSMSVVVRQHDMGTDCLLFEQYSGTRAQTSHRENLEYSRLPVHSDFFLSQRDRPGQSEATQASGM